MTSDNDVGFPIKNIFNRRWQILISLSAALILLFVTGSIWNHLDRSREWSGNVGWTSTPSPILNQGVIIGQPLEDLARPLSYLAPMVATYTNKYENGRLILRVLAGIDQPSTRAEIKTRTICESDLPFTKIKDNDWARLHFNPNRLEKAGGLFLLFELAGNPKPVPGPVSLWLDDLGRVKAAYGPAVELKGEDGKLSARSLSGRVSLSFGYAPAPGWASHLLRLPWSKWWPILIGLGGLAVFIGWCSVRPERLSGVAAVTTWLGLLVTTAIVVFGLRRGIDFTDEGCYLIQYANLQDEVLTPWHYQHMVNLILSPFSPGVMSYRWATLFSVIASSAFLFWPLKRIFGSDGAFHKWWLGIPFLCLGGLLTFTFGPPTLSYNHVSGFFLVLMVGFALLGLDEKSGRFNSEKIRGLWLACAGISTAFCFFAKFTTSLGLFFAIGLLILLVSPKKRRWVRIGSLSLGLVIGFAAYFSLVIDPSIWWSQFSLFITSFGKGDGFHSTGKVLHLYWLYLHYHIELGQWLSVGWGLAFWMGLLYRRKSEPARPRAGFMVLLSLGLTFVWYQLFREGQLWLGGTTESVFIPFGLLGTLALFSAGFTCSREPKKWRDSLLSPLGLCLTLLFLAPFLGVLGAYNPPTIQVLQHQIPWFGLLLFFTGRFKKGKAFLTLSSVIVIALALIIPVQVWTSYILKPFRLHESRLEQTMVVNTRTATRASGLLVSKERKEFIEGIDRILADKTDYLSGDFLLTEDMHPGLVWILGGRIPGNSPIFVWLSKVLDLKGLQKPKRVFLVFRKRSADHVAGVPANLVKKLGEFGVEYPKNYYLAGKYKGWLVYAPKNRG